MAIAIEPAIVRMRLDAADAFPTLSLDTAFIPIVDSGMRHRPIPIPRNTVTTSNQVCEVWGVNETR
ncbi:hypothetical protein D1872_333130 [compost metagenome]